ncbi:MAG: hypothetical protein OXF79_02535 [Chloroflexi bacterium]|nr:hypothetical protein [Chloroflexota bacterium]
MTEKAVNWRKVAEDTSSNPEARVLAAAIHTMERRKHDDYTRMLISDLGEDRVEQVMHHLVSHGLATWRVRPQALLDERLSGSIKATWEGYKSLEAAIRAAEEARRAAAEQARPWVRLRRMCAAIWQGLRSAAEVVTTIRKLVAFLIVGAAASVWLRGCGP